MLIYDLYCGAGGAAMGLYQAFPNACIIGVDIIDQPNYPFKFVRGDVTTLVTAELCRRSKPDLIWASPPCQSFTAYRRKGHGVGDNYLNLIPFTRDLLRESGRPYVIENVVGAPLIDPVRLCGSSFGLDIRRHRLFEASFPVAPLPCDHSWQTPRFPCATNRTNPRSTVEIGVWRIPLAVQQEAMGIDWMTLKELSEAVPPAYARYIGEQWQAWTLRDQPESTLTHA